MHMTNIEQRSLYHFRGQSANAADVAGHYPVFHYWDPQEQKLLVCETKTLAQGTSDKDKKAKPVIEVIQITAIAHIRCH